MFWTTAWRKRGAASRRRRMQPDAPPLARRVAAEGLGSFFLFACVIGSGIMAQNLSRGNDAVALLGNTLATGAILFVLITMLGPISGAHMNPAVSLVAASRRELSWGDAVAYIACPIRFRHSRRMGRAPDVRASDPPAVGEGAHRSRAMGRRVRRDVWLDPDNSRHRAVPARMGAGNGRALHHRRLLVHVLHQLRKSSNHRGPQSHQHIRGHRAARCPAVRGRPTGRRRPCCSRREIPLRPTATSWP